MRPVNALQRMRAKGYRVAQDGEGLDVDGPRPSDPKAFQEWLGEHKPGLMTAIDAEQHESVKFVEEVLGGRLRDVRTADEPDEYPEGSLIISVREHNGGKAR